MAGLVSGPRPPRQLNVVFVPAPSLPETRQGATNSTSPSASSGSSKNNSQKNQNTGSDKNRNADQGTLSDDQRITGILASRRGRRGTIRTGFTGILDKKTLRPNRKRLLGE